MIRRDKLFLHEDNERLWKKYCGFLDLSIDEYLGIQESLLMHQIDLVSSSTLGKKFMPYKPQSVADFRRIIPFTTYQDYARYLDRQSSSFLPEGHYQWACADKKDGDLKWIPFTQDAILAASRCLIGSVILACADKKDDVKIGHGSKILHNLPPSPYVTALYARVVAQQTGIHFIPNRFTPQRTESRNLTQRELESYLSSEIDLLAVSGITLYKTGEKLADHLGQIEFNYHILSPEYLWRLLFGWIRSQREHRNLLPRDIWFVKGILSSGPEAIVYQDKILEYWGKKPLMIYQAPEAGIIATQAWNKKNYTFLPTASFHEFIPEEEVLRNRNNSDYCPRTVLLNQVKPGKIYEVVISSFYGMPFLRYRLGDMIRIIDMEDQETGIKLPQMMIESRTDEMIEVGNLCRLNEKDILQAIANAGLKYVDWCLYVGEENGQHYLNIYIEPRENKDEKELEDTIETELTKISSEYRKNRTAQGSPFLKVIILPKGSFKTYREIHRQRESLPEHISTSSRYVSRSAVQQLENVKSTQKHNK